MAPRYEPAAIGLWAARALAWALLLSGWVGLGALSVQFTGGPLQAMALIAVWLFALSAWAWGVGRRAWPAWALRTALLLGAAVAAQGVLRAVHGGGLIALLPAVPAWALVVALASATVRARRWQLARRPAAPLAPAAAGAALAWLALGDPADLQGLAERLALLLATAVLVLVLVLAWLQPSGHSPSARAGCRAGLFDCALPAWPPGAWRSPLHWPQWLARLVMLPMMCSLPWMVAWCREASMPASAVVGLHLAAMFLPGWWFARRAGSSEACGPLLVLGAVAAVVMERLPGGASVGVWLLMAAHGSAWSLAWGAQLAQAPGLQPSVRPAARTSPLQPALLHAVLALALGAVLALAGPRGFVLWHLAIGALAAAALVAQAVCRLHRPLDEGGLRRPLGEEGLHS